MKVQIKTDTEKHLLEEMEKDKPSSDPEYWAKSGCKHCHGTGKLGVLSTKVGSNTIKNEQLCSCARKRWQKWQEQWKEDRKKQRAKRENNLEIESAVSRDDETDKVDVASKLDKLRPRINRIDDSIAQLRSEIFGLERRLNDMPQHAVIEGFEEQIEVSHKMFDSILSDIVARENVIDTLKQQAQNLISMAQQKQKAAAKMLTDTQASRNGLLKRQETQIFALETELVRVKKDLNRSSHGARRKVRVAQQKLDRLESRRRRIVIDAGLDPEMIPDEVDLGDPTPENHSSL